VAETEPFPYSKFDSIIEIEKGIIVVADGITDPRNLGAMIRSAVLLGANGIIIPGKYSSGITPVVCHTSAGATEKIAISKVESLSHSLRILQSKGFIILGAEEPSPETVSIVEFCPGKKTALVLGSEGKGLSKKVREICDMLVSIPQKSNFDSFNVSVAAAILLWELSKKS
jgi:23S rRNA (guanosine2251-2'-O)-methyltransferase